MRDIYFVRMTDQLRAMLFNSIGKVCLDGKWLFSAFEAVPRDDGVSEVKLHFRDRFTATVAGCSLYETMDLDSLIRALEAAEKE